MPVPVQTCPECGGALPANALDGLCPKCLAVAFSGETGMDAEMNHGPTNASDETIPQDVSLLPGKAEFLVEQELARGGMGIVYQAQDMGIGRRIVVKFLQPQRASDASAVGRFLAEARITGQLEHPAIVPVYHVGLAPDGQPFYAMRHIQGGSLTALLGKLREEDPEAVAQYPLGTLLNVFQKICDAVAYAHSRGVVHRDLKPDNVMIGSFGEVVVMDWGLAKTKASAAEDSPMPRPAPLAERAAVEGTMDNTILGTLGFMAPEQAEGQSNRADERTDVYALGAILYTILTLQAPIRGKDLAVMLDRTRSGDIRPPSDYIPGASRTVKLPHCPNRRIPNVLSAVAMKALARDPVDRYQQVSELQRDITAYQGGFATSAEQAGWFKQTALFIRRHKTASGAVLIILLLTAGFMAKIILSERRATATLARLRSTAPTFYELALSLVDEQKLDAALEKISFAISLAPDAARYHDLKGNILQTSLRLTEARDAYAEALKRDATISSALENHDLCAKLIKQKSGGKMASAGLVELQAALIHQGRSAESLILNALLKDDRQQLLELWKSTLASAGVPVEGKLSFDGEILALNLDKTSITNLTPLKGLPLTHVTLDQTKVTDLIPLKGMPLKTIWLSQTRVSDLGPLRGQQLRDIHMGFTRVRDLSALQGLKLITLYLNNTVITDLSPLRGMPLQDLNIGSTQIADLSPLRGMTSLIQLTAAASPVADLSPLRGLLLKQLQLYSTKVSDLTPLEGMPLVDLQLHDCRSLQDLSPLTNCTLLKHVTIPTVATNVHLLRHLPALEFISYAAPKDRWTNNAADFWKTYDIRNQTRK